MVWFCIFHWGICGLMCGRVCQLAVMNGAGRAGPVPGGGIGATGVDRPVASCGGDLSQWPKQSPAQMPVIGAHVRPKKFWATTRPKGRTSLPCGWLCTSIPTKYFTREINEMAVY